MIGRLPGDLTCDASVADGQAHSDLSALRRMRAEHRRCKQRKGRCSTHHCRRATCANESVLKSELHRLIDPLDSGPIFGLGHLPVQDEAQWSEDIVLDRGNVQADIIRMRRIGH